MAAAVAYSRVHTGVHYPSDAVAGALIGEGTGQTVASVMDRLPARKPRRHGRSGRGQQRELPDDVDGQGMDANGTDANGRREPRGSTHPRERRERGRRMCRDGRHRTARTESDPRLR